MHFKVYRHSLTESKRQKKMILLWKISSLNCIIASYWCPPLPMFVYIFITRAIMFSGFQTEKESQNFQVSRFFVTQAIKVPDIKNQITPKRLVSMSWHRYKLLCIATNLCTKPNSALPLTEAGSPCCLC